MRLERANQEVRMSGYRQLLGIPAAMAAISMLTLAGCGGPMTSTSSSGSGAIQPQSQPAIGPILGYVWDGAGQALRPVQGVPGASIVGNAILSAPSQGAAILASASSAVSGMALFLDANGNVFQAALTGGKPTQIASLPGASSLALSNSGAYALVTGKGASGANIVAVISGLPQSPSTRTLNVAALPAILGGVASDSGTVALAAGSGQSR